MVILICYVQIFLCKFTRNGRQIKLGGFIVFLWIVQVELTREYQGIKYNNAQKILKRRTHNIFLNLFIEIRILVALISMNYLTWIKIKIILQYVVVVNQKSQYLFFSPSKTPSRFSLMSFPLKAKAQVK